MIERALVVVERRDLLDGSFAAFDLWNTADSLKSTGMVDKVDVLYYGEYIPDGPMPNAEETLINYCIVNKPDVILLSIQSMVSRGVRISPSTVRLITHTMGIPTVMFWWTVDADSMVDFMETYSPTLNILGGVNSTSHKPIKAPNYIYTINAFDESLFNKPDGVRDISVGFLGSPLPFRLQWIRELGKFDIPVYIEGGQLVDGDTSFSTGKAPPLWMPYEEYLDLTSRMKIVLNFSSGMGPMYLPATSKVGQIERGLDRLKAQLKGGFSALVKNPSRLRYAMPALKGIASITVKKPREVVRQRVFEALWCRTLLLEEYNSITEYYFEPYVDYVPFTTLPDLVDKIRYYLENDEERDRIRMHGRATMEEYYNARAYWENVFGASGVISTRFQHQPREVWDKAHYDKWIKRRK